jgi:hypothetical protein
MRKFKIPSAPEKCSDRFPAELLKVGGIIGDLVRLFVDTAISPQPILALGAAICLIGTLAGRKYRTSSNIRTNVYAIGIADSGSGKDYARTVTKNALYAAGLSHFMGGGKIASGSGLLSSLERHPCRLFLLDEMGKFVKSVAGAKASPWREEIWTNLTELYTSSGSVYLGSEYADQKDRPRVDIIQPCCSIYGVTVPGAFWSALASSNISDGSLARFLIFLSDDDYPDRQYDADVGFVPEHIIDGLKAVVAGHSGVTGNLASLPMAPDIAPQPFTVPETAEAEQSKRLLNQEQLDWLRLKRGTPDTAIVARFFENVHKVALIRAISDCPANPTITAENLDWASLLVRHCISILLREATRHVADSPTDALKNMILNFIRKNREVTAEELGRGQGVRGIDAKTRNGLLHDMWECGLVVRDVRSTGGVRPATFFRLAAGV